MLKARHLVTAASLLSLSLAALAQSYPSKPIRLMIGYTAGGSAEAGARPLARALEPLLGQPLVFEYRPGNAGGEGYGNGYAFHGFPGFHVWTTSHRILRRALEFPQPPLEEERWFKPGI